MRSARGVTLIELMVALAVAAVLLTVGVPSFRNIIENNRLTSQTNDVVGLLNLARSEAVRRGAVTSVCPVGADWSEGMYVVNGTVCDPNNSVRQIEFNSQRVSVGLEAVPNPDSIEFNGQGATGVAHQINIEIPNRDKERTICINTVGRVRTQDGSC